MPIASIISSLIKLGIQFLLFISVYFYAIFAEGYKPHVGWGIAYLPLILLLLAGIGFGFGIIISSITTKYRDMTQLVGFGMQVLMYGTPVVYSYTSLSPDVKYWLSFNPLVAPVECFKYAFFGIGEFSGFSLLYSFGWMLLLLAAGIVLFKKAEKNFMDTV
jgi:lipopolysaccharide transport system permease protein